ncbi:MAG: S8/S53 family peptidase [Pseudomonadota bacterium]
MGKVRVLVKLSEDIEAKRVSMEAFTATQNNEPYHPDFTPQKELPGLDVDTAYNPIPLESVGRTPILAMSTPQEARTHVIRGEIDENRLEALTQIEGVSVFSDPQITHFSREACQGGPIGDVSDVRRRVNIAELERRNLDGQGVHIAICDTGINSDHLISKGLTPNIDTSIDWIPQGASRAHGNYEVGHGTMCAHAAMIAAPAATLIDCPLLRSRTRGRSAMEGLLSDAVGAYSFLVQQLTSGRINKLVVNNSWGMYRLEWDFRAGHPGRYADNPQHPFNLACATLGRAGADIYFASGNCGPSCPDGRCDINDSHSITGANAHPDVTTIAGVSTRNRLIGYSSQGPGITGMAIRKPNFASYTHYLGSEAYGLGSPDSGTSTACPVAAGLCAALRTSSKTEHLSPRDLARELKMDAITRSPQRRWNKRIGHGIYNAAGTAMRLDL